MSKNLFLLKIYLSKKKILRTDLDLKIRTVYTIIRHLKLFKYSISLKTNSIVPRNSWSPATFHSWCCREIPSVFQSRDKTAKLARFLSRNPAVSSARLLVCHLLSDITIHPLCHPCPVKHDKIINIKLLKFLLNYKILSYYYINNCY